MKTSKFVFAVLLLLMGSLTTELLAQKQLEAFVKKCSENKSIDKSVVQRKNPQTKVLEEIIRSYSFSENQSLLQELKNAFEQDKADAYQVIENENNGNVNCFLRFAKDKGNIVYSMDVNDNGASLTVIERFGVKDDE